MPCIPDIHASLARKAQVPVPHAGTYQDFDGLIHLSKPAADLCENGNLVCLDLAPCILRSACVPCRELFPLLPSNPAAHAIRCSHEVVAQGDRHKHMFPAHVICPLVEVVRRVGSQHVGCGSIESSQHSSQQVEASADAVVPDCLGDKDGDGARCPEAIRLDQSQPRTQPVTLPTHQDPQAGSKHRPAACHKDLRIVRGARDHDCLVTGVGQVSFVDAPKPRVDALCPVRDHQHMLCRFQRHGKGRATRIADHPGDIQVLRIGQHAAIRVASATRPGVKDFVQELKDSLLPSMCDKQVAWQPLRMQHQRPAHVSGLPGDWLDKLLRDGVDTWADALLTWVELVRTCWRDLPSSHRLPDSLFELQQITLCHTPSGLVDAPVQLVTIHGHC
mmetsp:Transcript_95633/g.239619  ORF Transcript_95633/g.239619 Transcript_95633/m.239619 type:complete len:389 (+) Transcript_95633:929-2095(+)